MVCAILFSEIDDLENSHFVSSSTIDHRPSSTTPWPHLSVPSAVHFSAMPRSFHLLASLLTLSCSLAWISSPSKPRTHTLTTKRSAHQQLGVFEALPPRDNPHTVVLHDWLDQTTEWQDAWVWQSQPYTQDRVVFLEHAPVCTLGTGATLDYVLDERVPLVRTDRGGEVTYHGPGQLVVYPILHLQRHYRADLHWYLRALEEAVLVALKKCGIEGQRDEETTGVWVNNYKVAAVGIKCRQWVSMHGVAINVQQESLGGFAGIVPCGLEGRKVGYINQFLDKEITVAHFAECMKEAFEEVFQVQLEATDEEQSTRSRETLVDTVP